MIIILNEEIARMGSGSRLQGERSFPHHGLRTSSGVVSDLEEDQASNAQQGKLQEIPGILHDLSEMIDEY
jgi:hypothetical protein